MLHNQPTKNTPVNLREVQLPAVLSDRSGSFNVSVDPFQRGLSIAVLEV